MRRARSRSAPPSRWCRSSSPAVRARHHPGQHLLRDPRAGLEPAGRLHRAVLAGARGVRDDRRLHDGAARLLLAGAAGARHPGRASSCTALLGLAARASWCCKLSGPYLVAHHARLRRDRARRDRQLARVHARRPGHARRDADRRAASATTTSSWPRWSPSLAAAVRACCAAGWAAS